MALNSGTRTENAGKNVLFATFNKLTVIILTFVSRKIFLEYIGIKYLGINSLFSNILTILSLAELGLGTAMNVSLYKPIAENDTKRLSAILYYFRRLYNYIALIIAVLGILLIPLLPYIVHLEEEVPYLKIYYVLFLANTVTSYLFVYKQAIINADQKNYLINKISIFINVLKVLLQIAVIILCRDYLIYIILNILATLANNIAISVIAVRNYPFIEKREKITEEDRSIIKENVFSLFLYKVSYCICNGTDNILISILIGTVSVGLYTNYLTITNSLETFVAILFTSLTASVGNLVTTSGKEKNYQNFKILQMISFWICGVLTVGLFYLTQDFIEIWLGAPYLLEENVLYAIILNVYFSTCMQPVWTYREGTGMYNQIRYIMLLTAVLNIILSVFLGKIMGLSGIIFATSISKALTYFLYEPKILFRSHFGHSPRDYYSCYAANLMLILFCILICYLPMAKFPGKTYFWWAVKAVVCMIFVNSVYLVRYHKTREFEFLKSKVFIFIHGGRNY